MSAIGRPNSLPTRPPPVVFINGLAFYNALRFNGKKAVMLTYPGEGHPLGGVANQKDLRVRFMAFFDHSLKGAPAHGTRRRR